MSDGGSMLDTYLIAQALGWDWNLGTILLIDGIIAGIFLLIIFVVGLLVVIFD